MSLQTALYDQHIAAGARMVDFAGWSMPLRYGSQMDEHHQVRRDAGMFDVSHMTVVDLEGPGCYDYLRHLLANDVAKLKTPGKALYSCMLNEQGGVVDDLITYYLGEGHYRVVVNAATREKDLAWMRGQLPGFELTLRERDDLAMIAVQGPKARERALPVLPADIRAEADALAVFTALAHGDWLIARTGYTGEDGFEIMLPNEQAPVLWQALRSVGVQPAGLAARDTLRLEAGMNLYGSDMDEMVSPLESGLAWTVAWEPGERRFVGREALERQREAGVERRFVGLVLEDKGVLRAHQRVVVDGVGEGETTSGAFSPTLGLSIALARVPQGTGKATGDSCWVDIRGKLLPVRVVRPPFVRHGRSCL